jgi:Zn-dependent protease
LSLSGEAPVVESSVLPTLFLLFLAWLLFYLAATALRLERYGVEINPFYAMYKSTALNDFLVRVGGWKPGLWRVVGNVGVASFFGQVAFMSYLLFKNLYRFIYVPREASPVMPLIPGVTISFQSLPWFLAAAGVVILLHELAHGVMCVVEGVEVKSAAVLLAVVTFGGAVEPDEEAMERAGLMSKLRIFASGSLVNLATGLLLVVVFIVAGGGLPVALDVFLHWLYFISVNLALVNMLPVYPLDGGQIMRTYLATKPGWGRSLERAMMFGFLGLMGSNLVLSLIRFGLIPL